MKVTGTVTNCCLKLVSNLYSLKRQKTAQYSAIVTDCWIKVKSINNIVSFFHTSYVHSHSTMDQIFMVKLTNSLAVTRFPHSNQTQIFGTASVFPIKKSAPSAFARYKVSLELDILFNCIYKLDTAKTDR